MFVSLGICNKVYFFSEKKFVCVKCGCSKKNAHVISKSFRHSLILVSKRLQSHIVSWKLSQLIQILRVLSFFRTKLEFVLSSNNNNNSKTANTTTTKTTTIITTIILVVKCVA